MIGAKEQIDLKTIKLVIWDLDETFWQGTLAEIGNLHLIDRNIELVETLVNKGIMNSICSKNDFKTVEEFFKSSNLVKTWDYFVFPSISWEPKGQRIKSLIENMQLRDENVLFIDDNTSNLNEALYFCPRLKIMTPDEISSIIEQVPLITKDDSEHSRLKQYKILETKQVEKEKSSSNEEFLYNSGIVVDIKDDCIENIDRLVELVNRTNQLNFTKIRTTKDELLEVLNNPVYKCGYVSVKDNFGDYGVVGFYALNMELNTLYHFLFSCRTLGMGIEQYVYSKLNYPKLEVVGEVVNNVVADRTIDWINNSSNKLAKNEEKVSCKVLYKGPCDLHSTLPYLSISKEDVTVDFNTVDDRGIYTKEVLCLQSMVNAIKCSKEEIQQICESVPFISEMAFEQKILQADYDVVIFSLLSEYRTCLYRNKLTNQQIAFQGLNIPFSDKHMDIADRSNWDFLCKEKPNAFNFTYEVLEKFSNEWECLGAVTAEQIIERFDYIKNHISPKTKWIIILGSEIEPEERLYNEMLATKFLVKQHRELNPKLKEYFNSCQNVDLICMTDIVEDNKNYTDMINHFTRKVYYKLAQEIVGIINRDFKQSSIKDIGKIGYCLREVKKLTSKVTSFIFSIGNVKSQASNKIGKYVKIFGIKFEFKRKGYED